MNDIFYCYSSNMYHFLKGIGFSYKEIGENMRTKTRFWKFQKSKKLDEAIEYYNILKHKWN